MEQNDYVKTGEDNNYEYYRNDSEVLSGDGEEEPYEEILKNREEFNVKINDKELTIKKRTLNRIMILSDCQPEEQILFSHYKTVKHENSKEQIKTKPVDLDNMRANNPTNLESLRNAEAVPYLGINQPLSDNNANVLIQCNTPNISPESNSDENDNVIFQKTQKADDLVNVGLPPQAVRIKWFYLLLVLCGFVDLIHSIINIIGGFNIVYILNSILALVLIFTGFFGYSTINKKIYNDPLLKFLTIVSAALPVVVFLANVIGGTPGYFVFGLIIHALTIAFAVLCLILTANLKKAQDIIRISQMEKLL
jgi:hypothetical protein